MEAVEASHEGQGVAKSNPVTGGQGSGPIGSAGDALKAPVADSAGRKATGAVRKYFWRELPYIRIFPPRLRFRLVNIDRCYCRSLLWWPGDSEG